MANEMNMLILIYAVFVYGLVSLGLFWWVRKDVINKLKLYVQAGKGAKLFSLFLKDGTRVEFVGCTGIGGKVEYGGDIFTVKRKTTFYDRNKNATCVTLTEGDVDSVDVFDRAGSRVDTKTLRALFFEEREKGRAEAEADYKLLRLLVIFALAAAVISLGVGVLTWQDVGKLLPAVQALGSGATKTAAQIAAGVGTNLTVVTT